MVVLKSAVIVDAVRTPMGKMNGALSAVPATELGSTTVRALLERTKLDPASVDLVVFGNVLTAGLGQNPARQVALRAGLPHAVSAYQVGMVCGSGMKAVHAATQAIKAGDADIVIAGGMESMSRAPYLLPGARQGLRLGNSEAVDSMIHDGLWCSFEHIHMGSTGDHIARKYEISRERQDAFALFSHQKAVRAAKSGDFDREIVPVAVEDRSGERTLVAADEGPRPDTSLEKLQRLHPVFSEGGTVTAGNASQISDAAAALVVMSEEAAASQSVKPLARIVDYDASGVAPLEVMIGPVGAIQSVLKRNAVRPEELPLFEENEAFASQTLAILHEVPIPLDRTNVHGGAVALGHPIGMSGARILTTLLWAMRKRQAPRGMAAMCLGGGEGLATLVEAV
ncbi:MAG TPA: acetyl-CoA C-acetyltransferase [Candidatus Thermoplasmatota archaeon]